MPAPTDRKCQVENCGRNHVAKGLCGGHYQQKRLGKPLTRITKSLPPKERFMAKVVKNGSCWEWQAYKTRDGYGACGFNGVVVNAHRVSWMLFQGNIPQGLEIDHLCHNRGCVNPQHLQLVTRKQNMENQSGPHANSKTGIRGVHIKGNRFIASSRHNSQTIRFGSFATLDEAERAVIGGRNQFHTNNILDRNHHD